MLVAGTEFKIYDLDHKKYVEQVTTYPTVTVHKSFFTDSQGYLILPKNLEIGHYRIEEVTAPDGYVVNKNYVEITVDSDTAYEVDGVSGDVIIEVSYEDQPVKGNLIVYKKGEMLSGFENDFIYKEQYLSGAELKYVRRGYLHSGSSERCRWEPYRTLCKGYACDNDHNGRGWKSCSKGSAAWKILCSGNKGTGRICIKSGASKGCINLSGSGYTDR